MKMKFLFPVTFIMICCLFLLTCRNSDSLKPNESKTFQLQATLTTNENKFGTNKNSDGKNLSIETEQVFDLPKIEIAKNEYEKYRQKLFFALLKQKVISPANTLINFSHVCNLKTGKNSFLVVNIFELIKNASSDRGYSRVIILDSSLKVANTLTVFGDSSFFCEENKLYLHNTDIGFNADKSSGNSYYTGDNTIMFDEEGKVDGSQTTDFRTLPALQEKLKKGLVPQ